MTLSELIIKYRADQDISQRQMAAQCGLSTGYISLIEKETNPQTGKPMVPSLVVLNKLAKGMAMSIDELLSICDDMPVDLAGTDNKMPALRAESGHSDPLDAELVDIIMNLSQDKKIEALHYLRYLAKS